MNKNLLLGLGRFLLRIPRPIWQQEVARSARATEKSLAFMTEDHHKIRVSSTGIPKETSWAKSTSKDENRLFSRQPKIFSIGENYGNQR